MSQRNRYTKQFKEEAMLTAGGEPLEPYPGYDVPWKVSAYVMVENQVQCIETSAKAKELVFGVVQITEICQLMSTSFMIKIIAW